MRMTDEFHLKGKISKVSFPNSGSRIFSSDGVVDPIDVAVRIKETIDKIENIRATEDGAEAIKSYLYARPTKELQHRNNLTEVERKVVFLKKRLMDDTLRYNVLKHKGADARFSEELLRLFGFQPCGLCCKE